MNVNVAKNDCERCGSSRTTSEESKLGRLCGFCGPAERTEPTKALTAKQQDALAFLRTNYHGLATMPSPDGTGTVYETGINTRVLARLLEAGVIEGRVYLSGQVLNLRVK
jgi:hypothetical protein